MFGFGKNKNKPETRTERYNKLFNELQEQTLRLPQLYDFMIRTHNFEPLDKYVTFAYRAYNEFPDTVFESMLYQSLLTRCRDVLAISLDWKLVEGTSGPALNAVNRIQLIDDCSKVIQYGLSKGDELVMFDVCEAYSIRVQCYMDSQMYREAVKDLTSWLDLELPKTIYPNFSLYSIYDQRSRCFLELKNYPNAQEDAIRMQISARDMESFWRSTSYTRLAEVYAAQGFTELAEEQLRIAEDVSNGYL